MKIVITGATGNLGRLVVEKLLERDVAPEDVTAVGRDLTKIKDLADRGVAIDYADYADLDAMTTAFAGADRVLLVSISAGGTRPADHRTPIDAAKAAGGLQLVYTSMSRADSASMRLAAEHRDTEHYLRSSGVPFTILRNGWYLENYTDQLPLYLQHGVAGSAGDGRVSAASRADLAEAAAVVVTTEGHLGSTYDLAGDESFTLPELATAISSVADTTVTYTDLPVEVYAGVLSSAGVPAPLAEVLADADRGLARGELESNTGDLHRLLGRAPTTLQQALTAATRT